MLRPTRLALAGLLGLALAGLGSVTAQRAGDRAPAAPLSGKEIYQRTLKSTVWIVRPEPTAMQSGRGVRIGIGSGALIDVPSRLILTNYHVVENADVVVVFFPSFTKQGDLVAERDYYFGQLRQGGGMQGKVVARDPKVDLALIQLPKLPSGVQSLRLARESVGPGDTVHSVGNPGVSGALWAYTQGVVKAVYRKQFLVRGEPGSPAMEIAARVVETTSPVNPGDSGGPVVNGVGELAAVTQSGLSEDVARAISIFIDISEVKALLKKSQFAKVLNNQSPGAPQPPAVAAKDDEKAAPKAASAEDDAEKQEKLAQAKLGLAQQFLRDRPDRARERLEEIIKTYPKTKAAQEAKQLLEKMKK